jgi:hypothetical protein
MRSALNFLLGKIQNNFPSTSRYSIRPRFQL